MGYDDFVSAQKERFDQVEEGRFLWQTKNIVIAALERKLLDEPSLADCQVLEVGCGGGANLFHLGKKGRVLFGLDFSMNRLLFAKSRVDAILICGDALRLPFREASFEAILVRDVVHHLPMDEQGEFISQLAQIMEKDGALVVIEGNPGNPMVLGFSYLKKSEENLRHNSAGRLKKLLESNGFIIEKTTAKESFPYRLILHYVYGIPKISDYGLTRKILALLERVLTAVIPRKYYMYTVLVCRRT